MKNTGEARGSDADWRQKKGDPKRNDEWWGWGRGQRTGCYSWYGVREKKKKKMSVG